MSEIEHQSSKGLAARLDNNKFARSHPEFWKFVKSLAGGLVTCVPGVLAYMWLCRYLTETGAALPDNFFFDFLARVQRGSADYSIPALVYAFIASTFIGQALAFIPNRKLAFRANSNAALSIFLMVCLAVGTILLNGIVGPAIAAGVFRLAAWLAGTETLSAGVAGAVNLVIKVLSMAATVLWCYPVNRFIIHRVRKEKA